MSLDTADHYTAIDIMTLHETFKRKKLQEFCGYRAALADKKGWEGFVKEWLK